MPSGSAPTTAISRSPSTSGALLTPQVGMGRAVVGGEVGLPADGAGLDIQTQQPPGGAQHVHPIAVDGRGRAGPDGVGGHQHAVAGAPLAAPEHLAGRLVQRQHAFHAVGGA